jgi:hypothetical protein
MKPIRSAFTLAAGLAVAVLVSPAAVGARLDQVEPRADLFASDGVRFMVSGMRGGTTLSIRDTDGARRRVVGLPDACLLAAIPSAHRGRVLVSCQSGTGTYAISASNGTASRLPGGIAFLKIGARWAQGVRSCAAGECAVFARLSDGLIADPDEHAGALGYDLDHSDPPDPVERCVDANDIRGRYDRPFLLRFSGAGKLTLSRCGGSSRTLSSDAIEARLSSGLVTWSDSRLRARCARSGRSWSWGTPWVVGAVFHTRSVVFVARVLDEDGRGNFTGALYQARIAPHGSHACAE